MPILGKFDKWRKPFPCWGISTALLAGSRWMSWITCWALFQLRDSMNEMRYLKWWNWPMDSKYNCLGSWKHQHTSYFKSGKTRAKWTALINQKGRRLSGTGLRAPLPVTLAKCISFCSWQESSKQSARVWKMLLAYYRIRERSMPVAHRHGDEVWEIIQSFRFDFTTYRLVCAKERKILPNNRYFEDNQWVVNGYFVM